MEKETYGSYEYVQDNEENEENQLIVVQEDGTILTVNRPIQYLTQVQDVKEALDDEQSNIAFDVSQQQFYVNVDNSSELVSVSDQFIIPESENNVYANSFLIQAVENDKDEQMEQGIPAELNTEPDNNAIVEGNLEESAENKTNGDCTEITLSDDQYQLLEKKGWILLETADKIYLLDTLGLHDITADKKLIEKLRYESQIDTNEESSTNIAEHEEVTYENNGGNFDTAQFEESMDYVIEDGIEHQTEEVSYINNEQEDHTESDNASSKHFPHDYVKLNSVKDTSYRREGEALRIKTKFSFKDIPPEIVLGRTVTGKKLIASVKTERHGLKSALTNKAVGDKFQRVPDEESEEHLQNDTGLDAAKFDALLQENLWGNPDNCSKKDVTAAEIVVEQLLRVSSFKPTIIERRLLVTKVVIEEHKTDEMYTETVPTLVTGRVMRKDSKLYFVHIPDLLRRSLKYAQGGKKVNEDYLHIHIREMKGADGITRISITLNKRHLPMATLASKARNKQKMAFACSACAAVYKTEEGLKLHQETECLEIDDLKVEAEADNSNNSFSVVLAGNNKQYMCNQCHSMFTKLSNCQNHIKTHYSQENATQLDETNKKEIRKIDGVYKCNMCPSTYLHAATLSKHIVTKHIKIKSN